MLSRFTLSFLSGLIVSFLFVRSIARRGAVDENTTTDWRARATPIRATGLSKREQRVLLSVLLAGAIAWSLHLMVGYAIASMGCTFALNRMALFGLSAIPFLIGLVTLLAALVSACASVLAYRKWKHIELNQVDGLGYLLTSGGVVLNGLFTVLILFEAVPALLVRPCA